MRFQGRRNFAWASPKVRVEMKTSFWNSRRDFDVGVLVAELDALAEEATASFDVRVGGVGIVEAELRAEVAQGLRLPTLHGRVTHGDDGHEVGVVELGHRLGHSFAMSFIPAWRDRVDISLGDGGGIAVDHAVPQRLGRGGTRFLSAVATPAAAAAPRPAERTALPALPPPCHRRGRRRQATTDNRGVGCDARAERRLLLLELVHVLLELVGGRAALRERREWMAGEGQRERSIDGIVRIFDLGHLEGRRTGVTGLSARRRRGARGDDPRGEICDPRVSRSRHRVGAAGKACGSAADPTGGSGHKAALSNWITGR